MLEAVVHVHLSEVQCKLKQVLVTIQNPFENITVTIYLDNILKEINYNFQNQKKSRVLFSFTS